MCFQLFKGLKWWLTHWIWVRSWKFGCLVTWFCYHLIEKPGNKTAAVSWPDPYHCFEVVWCCKGMSRNGTVHIPAKYPIVYKRIFNHNDSKIITTTITNNNISHSHNKNNDNTVVYLQFLWPLSVWPFWGYSDKWHTISIRTYFLPVQSTILPVLDTRMGGRLNTVIMIKENENKNEIASICTCLYHFSNASRPSHPHIFKTPKISWPY